MGYSSVNHPFQVKLHPIWLNHNTDCKLERFQLERLDVPEHRDYNYAILDCIYSMQIPDNSEWNPSRKQRLLTRGPPWPKPPPHSGIQNRCTTRRGGSGPAFLGRRDGKGAGSAFCVTHYGRTSFGDGWVGGPVNNKHPAAELQPEYARNQRLLWQELCLLDWSVRFWMDVTQLEEALGTATKTFEILWIFLKSLKILMNNYDNLINN